MEFEKQQIFNYQKFPGPTFFKMTQTCMNSNQHANSPAKAGQAFQPVKSNFVRMKTIILMSFLILLNKLGYNQQLTDIRNYQIDILRNEDVFINNKMINPVLLQDSNGIHIDFIAIEQWLGKDAPKEYVLTGETSFPKKGLSLGFNTNYFEQGIFQHYSITGQIKKRIWKTNNSKIDFGINLGVWQFRSEYTTLNFQLSEPLYNKKTEWITSPIVDVGFSYIYKNQFFGIAYNNMIASKFVLGDSEFVIQQSGLVVNYRAEYLLTKDFAITPEIYGCFQSVESYLTIVGKISYKQFLSAGILYNSQNKYGFLMSVKIKKRIKVGYFFDQGSDTENKNQNYGSHGVNLGLILK